MKSSLMTLLSCLTVSQSALAVEVVTGLGTAAQSTGSGGSVYQIVNLSTGSCGEFVAGQFVEYVDSQRCPQRGGLMTVASIVERSHQLDDLGLTPKYSALNFPSDTRAIVIDSERKMSFQNEFYRGVPNNGCVFNLDRSHTGATGLSSEMTIILKRPKDNVKNFRFIPWIPDQRRWIATNEVTGEVIGDFACDTDVSSKRGDMERLLNRWWHMFADVD